MKSIRTGILVFAAAFLASHPTLSAQTTNAVPPKPAPPKPFVLAPGEQDVVFGKGGEVDLHALIDTPTTGKGPFPAIIWVYGGAWRGGNYKTGWAARFAQHGYFGASIQYRLSGVAKWPAQIEDCKCAVRWLRANAAKYNIDPNRIGVWGESAGGHLVSCLDTMADEKQYEGDGGWPGVSSAPNAVVDWYGPSDLTRSDIMSKEAISGGEGLFGCKLAENPALWKSGCPLYFVKVGDAPILIAQGDADVLVPMAQSTIFNDALTKAGVPHQLLIVKNAGHQFRPLPGTTIDPSQGDVVKACYAFLDKYLKAP